jgi:hypothetical protein
MEPDASTVPQNYDESPQPRRSFRWRLWLALASPFVFLAILAVFVVRVKSQYVPVATAASVRLHEQLEHSGYEQIYSDADALFKMKLTKDVAIKFLARVHRKLGNCQYSGPTTWQVNASQNGAIVVLTFRDRCLSGEADETSTWRVFDGRASLVGLNVNSPVLLTD